MVKMQDRIGIAAAAALLAGMFSTDVSAQTQMSRDPSFCEVYNALGGAPSDRCAGQPSAPAAAGAPGGLTLQGTTQGVRPTSSMIPPPSGDRAGAPPATQSRQAAPSRPSSSSPAVAPARAAASFGSVQFEYDSANLTNEATRVLDTVAAVLNDTRMADRVFIVEGHTDATGGPAYNYPLSERRAQAVVQYLSSRHGIPKSRLQSVGKGQSQLADPGNPTSAANRRVVILNAGGG